MTKKELIKYLTNEIIYIKSQIEKERMEDEPDFQRIMYLDGNIDGMQKSLTEVKKLSFKHKDKED